MKTGLLRQVVSRSDNVVYVVIFNLELVPKGLKHAPHTGTPKVQRTMGKKVHLKRCVRQPNLVPDRLASGTEVENLATESGCKGSC